MNDRVVPRIAEVIGGMSVAQSEPQGLFLNAAIFLPGRIVSRETFRLTSFSGQEGVSEPFEFQLELHGNTEATTQQPMRFTDLIGRPVTVGVAYPGVAGQHTAPDDFIDAVNGRANNRASVSYFNGIVTAFAMEDQGVYRATMKPALYKLTLTNRYQIYAHQNVRQVIEELMRRHRVAYSVEAIKGLDASGRENLAECRVQDWLQAGESDYELLRRLMAKAHVYYYVRHEPTGHTVVFANRPDYPQVHADRRVLRYTATLTDEVGQHQPDLVVQYNYQMSLQASGVTGSAVRQEAAWERDAVAVPTAYHYQPLADSGELPFHQYKIYQYGYSSNELQEYAENTQLTLETAASQLSGASTCAFFHVGHQFALTDQPWSANPDPVRPSLNERNFVLTSVKHDASLDGSYQNQFQACVADGLITPFSLADTQQGAVLAVVVPPPPPSDWRYYDKNVYNPQNAPLLDSRGDQSKLDARGVFVRFTTEENAPSVWVKLSASMQTVPEYGVTVTITRAQDESELPEVQSIVQSNGNKVIMPSTWTAGSHTGNSYSTSYGDSKRISYGINSKYDLPAAINIVTAAYDRGVFKDAGYSQGAGYNYSTSESRETGILSESWSYGCGYSNSWAKENKSFSAIGRTYSESVIGDSSTSLQSTESSHPQAAGAVQAGVNKVIGDSYNSNDVTGNSTAISNTIGNSSSTSTQTGNVTRNDTHTGNVDSNNLQIGNSTSCSVQIGNSTGSQILLGNSDNVSVHLNDSALSMVVQDMRINTVGASVGVSATGSSSSMSMVGMSMSVNAVGSNISQDAVGMAMSDSMTGMRMSNSMTGMVMDNSVLGMSVSSSVAGMTVSDSTVGMSLQTSTAGMSTSISNSGISNSFEFTGGGIQYSNRPAKPEMETKSVTINIMVGVKIYL